MAITLVTKNFSCCGEIRRTSNWDYSSPFVCFVLFSVLLLNEPLMCKYTDLIELGLLTIICGWNKDALESMDALWDRVQMKG